ncbi:MAG TPA: hypothetical protein VEZ44_02910 [bacterium]|nr:hypothetical protein [bacterium]
MRGWLRLIFAVAGLAGGALVAVVPASAQAPTIPQQAPAGTTAVSVGDPVILQPGSDTIGPVPGGEVTSVTSSDPSVVTVDANYSSFGGGWNLNYQCKKAGVAVVTVVLKNGTKYAKLVGCGVRFPLQTVDYTKGHYNSNSYLAWVDQKGTLVVSGAYQDADNNTQALNIAVSNYGVPKSAPARIPPPANTNNQGGE